MLTLIETISLAGDRAKQNDDVHGFAHGRAWVIDGATDLDEPSLTGWRSDAAWVAHAANAALYNTNASARAALRAASESARASFIALTGELPEEQWRWPIASLIMGAETDEGFAGIDLGDCRIFALDADGAAFCAGGPEQAADAETALATQQTDADKPLLRRTETIAKLRRLRGMMNRDGSHWTFCLDPECAARARDWAFSLKRPAHLLLATDGFAALTDRYRAYDPSGFMHAALSQGLHELARELRTIEHQDSDGGRHPRFKRSDDATAMLLRLE